MIKIIIDTYATLLFNMSVQYATIKSELMSFIFKYYLQAYGLGTLSLNPKVQTQERN